MPYLKNIATGDVVGPYDADSPIYQGLIAQRDGSNKPVYEEATSPDSNASSGGNVTVVRFPFAHDTPNLHLGVEVYEPKIGDVLLDAWIEITERWNGTTPLADIGPFPDADHNFGLFGNGMGPLPLDRAPDPAWVGDSVISGQLPPVSVWDAVSNVYQFLKVPALDGNAHAQQNLQQLSIATAIGIFRTVPARLVGSAPLKIVVSQDGSSTGAATASTTGQAVANLLIARPA